MLQSRVLTFDNPESYAAAVRATDVELLVTSSGDFSAELIQVDFGRLLMQRGADSLPRIARISSHSKRAPIVFLADVRQASVQQNGVEVAPGEIIVHSAGATSHQRTEGPCRWAAMSPTSEDLAAASAGIIGRELTPPSTTQVIKPDPRRMAHVMSLHEATMHLARIAPGTLAHPQLAKALEQELVQAMVTCLDAQPLAERRSGVRQHSRIVARFEDFLAARRYEPAYLAEICAAIGVSERTLRTCCHEHLGMGPIHFLWLRRMHLAHRALLHADPAIATVTQVATEYGFWELGRFSVEYRALFGESPSASLHRPAARAGDRQSWKRVA
ncbi:AraC-type DNA-binding protein [Rhodospirillales bacterium URHD0017]|nr:AraC-type DNA-binding protein [Rhodospirillales bacterium URHD0017]